MNIELTPKQVEFVERAIASGQYGSAEEVLSQVWAIGTREVEQAIAQATELVRAPKVHEPDTTLACEYEEFIEAIAKARR